MGRSQPGNDLTGTGFLSLESYQDSPPKYDYDVTVVYVDGTSNRYVCESYPVMVDARWNNRDLPFPYWQVKVVDGPDLYINPEQVKRFETTAVGPING